jgi:hypothetical protein
MFIDMDHSGVSDESVNNYCAKFVYDVDQAFQLVSGEMVL